MSEPPIISPSQPQGHDQWRTYVQICSIVPRSTVLRGVPKRFVTTCVSTTIMEMLPTRGRLYTETASMSEVIVLAASGGWKCRP